MIKSLCNILKSCKQEDVKSEVSSESHLPKISVIIPIYNVESYLGKALESIINQSFSDIEIICVDDGSTDNSLQIIKEYEKNDKRIKIISKENGGVSSARNAGVDIAQGEYLYMYDPDDWVESRILEVLYKKALKNNSEITECDFVEHKSVCVDSVSKKKLKIKGNFLTKVKVHFGYNYSVKDLGNHMFSLRANCWNKLYKKELIEKNNIRFRNVNIEDYFFNLESFLCAKSICYINEYLYHYCIRENSYSTKQNTDEEININTKSICFNLNLVEEILKKTRKYSKYNKNNIQSKRGSKGLLFMLKYLDMMKEGRRIWLKLTYRCCYLR